MNWQGSFPLSHRDEPPGARVWGVAALVQAVADTLSARYGTVVVRGEVSGLSRAASGHAYFTLKDESGQAALRCAMFRRALSQVDFPLSEGQLIEARGRLSVYESRGELQLVVDSVQRAGAGALYEQFLRLRARLEAQGLFDEGRKRALGDFPRRVAVVTSLGAAALRDVVTALRRRAPHVEVLIVPTLVQGPEAPPRIVDAISTVGAMDRSERTRGRGIDVMILCRGGGSLEDLWAFNDERVVRAVAASTVPVICGVGHETDTSLADLAADLRAPTPTAAAELVALPRTQALADLAGLHGLLHRRVHQRLEQQVQKLDHLSLRLCRPVQLVHRQQQQLGRLEARLQASLREDVARARHRLAALPERLSRAFRHSLSGHAQDLQLLGQRLASVDPRRVLERGYALLTDASGHPVLHPGQVQVGQGVRVELAEGRLDATVTAVEVDAPGREA